MHTHCANLSTLIARPSTVEIWRTFEGPLGASAICSFSLPLWMFTTGCRGVVFVGSSTSGTLSGTSCDSTCESFRCRFLSLDVRLNIHVARNVGLTLFITVALLCFETLLQAWQKRLPSSKEMRSLDAKSLVLTFSRATRPTFIESFFVFHRGEGLRSRILTVAGHVPEGLARRARPPSRPTRLDMSLRHCSFQQQADVVCTVNLRGTCCTNFMRGR